MRLRETLLVLLCAVTMQNRAVAASSCAAIEDMVDLAARYSAVYANHGDAHNALDLREREAGLRQRFANAGCGDLARSRAARRQLTELWESSGRNAEWRYLGQSDSTHLQYIVAHRREADIGVWLIYNYPGTIPDGKHVRGTGRQFKSSAQLVRLSCRVALYMDIGSLWFGDGSTLGEIVGIEGPADDGSAHSVPETSLMQRLRTSECPGQ